LENNLIGQIISTPVASMAILRQAQDDKGGGRRAMQVTKKVVTHHSPCLHRVDRPTRMASNGIVYSPFFATSQGPP
jgi:hypothetical protein